MSEFIQGDFMRLVTQKSFKVKGEKGTGYVNTHYILIFFDGFLSPYRE